jgi:hypothetical protein
MVAAGVGGFMNVLASATVISPWQKATVIVGTPVGLAFGAVVAVGVPLPVAPLVPPTGRATCGHGRSGAHYLSQQHNRA